MKKKYRVCLSCGYLHLRVGTSLRHLADKLAKLFSADLYLVWWNARLLELLILTRVLAGMIERVRGLRGAVVLVLVSNLCRSSTR